MTAKRLSALPQSPEILAQEQNALLGAAHFFASADRFQTSHNKTACAMYAQPIAHRLRSWGDALLHLNRPQEALAVFTSSAAQLLWSDPFCRPSYQSVILRGSEIFAVNKYIVNASITASLFTHVQKPVVQLLLPLLRHALATMASNDISALWVPESAGLHKGRTWSTIVFWANGQPGSACAAIQQDRTNTFAEFCSLLQSLIASVPGMNPVRGQIKLSRMLPGTVVRAHAGPTNERLRMHCSVEVPSGSTKSTGSTGLIGSTEMGIRVGSNIHEWHSWSPSNLTNGIIEHDDANACFVFREECEHEVVIGNRVPIARTILIVDFVNPFLNSLELYQTKVSKNVDRRSLSEHRTTVEEEYQMLQERIDRIVSSQKNKMNGRNQHYNTDL